MKGGGDRKGRGGGEKTGKARVQAAATEGSRRGAAGLGESSH